MKLEDELNVIIYGSMSDDNRCTPQPISGSALVLCERDKDRIIEMAWEDRTPFDAIFYQFGLRECEVRRLMKAELKFSSYRTWRSRVEACATKHVAKRSPDIERFKCARQRAISQNKISKR